MKHSGLKPFICDECEKQFSRSCDLKHHKMIHSGLKPFNCDQCSKAIRLIRTKSKLDIHKRSHTGERPYVTCSHAFSTNSELTKHRSIHTGEKPYNVMIVRNLSIF